MIGGTEILREMSFLKIIFGPDFTPELYRMLIFGLAWWLSWSGNRVVSWEAVNRARS
ncbi:inner-membrane translocator [Brucella ceti TE28753-12]|nr:inner-membrane translocator [Brucella ceti TE28753-12]